MEVSGHLQAAVAFWQGNERPDTWAPFCFCLEVLEYRNIFWPCKESKYRLLSPTPITVLQGSRMFSAKQASRFSSYSYQWDLKCLHLGCRPKSSFRVSTVRRSRLFLFAWYHFISSKPSIKSLHRWPCHKLCTDASVRLLPHPPQYNCSSKSSVQPKIKEETKTICTFGFLRTFSSILLLGHMLTSGCWEKADPNSSVGFFQGRIPHKPWRLSVQTLQTQDIVVGGGHWFSDFKFPSYSLLFLLFLQIYIYTYTHTYIHTYTIGPPQ